MVAYVGTANRTVAELAMRRTMSMSYGDGHVNKSRITHVFVQRLQVWKCCG